MFTVCCNSQVDEILQTLQRDVNSLHDGTRFAKKKALERIRAQTTAKLEQVIVLSKHACSSPR